MKSRFPDVAQYLIWGVVFLHRKVSQNILQIVMRIIRAPLGWLDHNPGRRWTMTTPQRPY